ncbi:MAG: BMP family ABC transporter substrate-binding protein [Deinococcota bacterium]|nr:BMP family ABC transporter substrate-binding protein [Deinococcota bacterium]
MNRLTTLAVLVLLVCGVALAQLENMRAGFIYVGPVGDFGWTYSHDQGRQAVDERFDWLETVFVESVAEGDTETFIDQLVRQGANVIFTTSFGFGEGTLAAAQRYPEVIFAHATGFQRAPNVMTYIAEFYQLYYLNGLMAGALTESNKVGYVAAFPIPEVKRHINAFALGVRETNPEAVVEVRWLYNWFDPAGAAEATQALIAEGADVFAFSEDTPTVIQTAAERGLPSFAHYSAMYDFAPDHVVSGQLANWEAIYADFLEGVHSGEYTAETLEDVDYWWLLAEGAVELGARGGMPINPAFEEPLRAVTVDDPELGEVSVYDLVMARHEAMSEGGPEAFDPFTGPVMDRRGNVVVAAGVTPGQEELETLEWAAEGVSPTSPWDNEP